MSQREIPAAAAALPAPAEGKRRKHELQERCVSLSLELSFASPLLLVSSMNGCASETCRKLSNAE